MEKLNRTSEENNFDNSFNVSKRITIYLLPIYSNLSGNASDVQILKWVDWISMGVGLPLTLIVIVTIFLQVKKDQGVPVYVINLLFSDLIQFCGRIMALFRPPIGLGITYFGFIASVGFMVCISLERYLIIAKPLWYRFRRNIKTYVVVCAVVWTLPLIVLLTLFLTTDPTATPFSLTIISSLLLLPFPFFIFCLVGTIKALSGALSVPAEEKRRITAIQVVVLLMYTVLFLPMILSFLVYEIILFPYILFPVCLLLSPLADPILYLLSRKSFLDKFLASLCSCKASDNQEMSSKDTESTTAPHTETV
ncbi:proteinase-activated receptor 1-like [Fundulus heteroclitus]|uniref:proteinase-activated receptor 1-like n=1 Tax=Fundulus heteroclitus TaxID=8078 RepID=UPI00165BFAD2|nr:proteinase-activated receptor 1-like [Fundulus heteroclitus]